MAGFHSCNVKLFSLKRSGPSEKRRNHLYHIKENSLVTRKKCFLLGRFHGIKITFSLEAEVLCADAASCRFYKFKVDISSLWPDPQSRPSSRFFLSIVPLRP